MGKPAYNWFVNMFEKNKTCFAMIFVELAYAAMAVLSKAAISNGMNPYVFVAYRQAFATIALAPFAFFFDRKNADRMSCGLIFKVFLVSLFGISLSLNLYSYSIQYVSATFSSASINTIPAITFIVAVAFRIETFSTKGFSGMIKVLGTVVSLSGVAVFALVKGPRVNWLSGRDTDQKNSITHSSTNGKLEVQGCLLMLLANAVWACWLVMQASLVKQYPAKICLTMLQCFFSCIQSSIWAICVDNKNIVSSWRLRWDLGLLSVAYCGVVVTGISYWLQLLVVESKGPLYVAAFTPLMLVFTAIVSAFIWKEVLCLGSVCGGVLVVGGLYCVIWGKNREAAAVEEEEVVEGASVRDVKEETNIV